MPEHTHVETPIDIDRWQELEDLKYQASLVQCRIAAGLTVHDLAVAMGISDSYIERIENFAEDPHLSTLRRYAAAVGAVVHHSVGRVPGAEEPQPEPSDCKPIPVEGRIWLYRSPADGAQVLVRFHNGGWQTADSAPPHQWYPDSARVLEWPGTFTEVTMETEQ